VLVELGLVEHRYQAVLEVLSDGAKVTDVARRTSAISLPTAEPAPNMRSHDGSDRDQVRARKGTPRPQGINPGRQPHT
jgi:hypothetical protein